MNEWKEYKLSDFININPSLSLKKGSLAKYVPMEYLTPYRKAISIYEYKNYNGGTKFQNRDVLVARITPCLENGKTAFVDFLDSQEVAFGSTEYLVFREKDRISYCHFIYYFSIYSPFRDIAVKSMTGSSGRRRIQTNFLADKTFLFPPLEEQRAIASVLSCLDEKIENLRRQNETLEAIAQTLFKHWFIDFEFPNDDGKPYKSSGGEMRSTELGEIPKDWRVGNMQDIIDVRDGTHDSPKQVESGFHLITSKHLQKEGINFNSAYLISENDYIEVNKRSKVNRFDILLSMIGTVGLIYFVLDTEINFAIKNIGLFRTSQNLKYAEFIYLFLQSSYGSTYFKTRLAGTTQSYITLGSLREMPLIIPKLIIIENFRSIIKPIFDKYYLNNQQIQTLTKTRDELLPKLMSGQLRV